MGRLSKLTLEIKEKIIDLYRLGQTDVQVAKAVGVTERTINNWKGKNPEFFQALKGAKAGPDMRVEASLFHRAIGYSHPEEKIFLVDVRRKDPDTGIVTLTQEPLRVQTVKHYPPDVTAQIFWLKNRKPLEWRAEMAPPPIEPLVAIALGRVTFIEYCVNSGYPAPYPKQLEMRDFCFTETDPRLLLGARGYGKTDYGTVLGVGYDIYCHGVDTTNLIISKSKSRNSAMIWEIAESLEANGVELDKRNSTCIRVKGLIGKDHSCEALTIKTSFRGRHPKRILMDDPVTEEDTSEAMRILVKKKYDEAYKLCKNIVIIGQPAHQFDLYAELRPLLKLLEVPHGMIPELDADLEAMALAGVDKNSIEMSYHLRIPKDGASIFSNLSFIDSYPAGPSLAFIDPSDGGDFTALTVGRGHFQGLAVTGYIWKKPWWHCLEEIAQAFKDHDVRRCAFEINKHGRQPVEQLQALFGPVGIGIVEWLSSSNKEAIIALAGAYAHQLYLAKDAQKAYSNQVIKYGPDSKHDDAPDSLARLLESLGLIRVKIKGSK